MNNQIDIHGIALIKIEPGSFLMGSDFDVVAGILQQQMIVDLSWEPEISVEWPQHLVEISKSFYISKYPVTGKVYRGIMTENSIVEDDDKPVLLDWQQVDDFLLRLNNSDSQFYFRLPTEAEWEYCCKSGAGYEFLTSDDCDDNKKAIVSGDIFQELAEIFEPVGSSGKNGWGIYDMLGNVPEWCSDFFDPDYYLDSPVADPENRAESSVRVMKGAPCFDWIENYDVPYRASARHPIICTNNDPGKEGVENGFSEDENDYSGCCCEAGLRLIAIKK